MHQDTADVDRRLAELEREVIRLRAEKRSAPAGEEGEAGVNRRGFLTKAGAVALGAGAASLASVLSAAPAAATTGTMQYGAINDAGSDSTLLLSTSLQTLRATSTGETGTAVVGDGEGTGVYGRNYRSTGIGVKGETDGVGSGVYGLATANGVGVYGDAPANGTGVVAKGTTGNALVVNGKAQFSRSGSKVVAGTLTAPKSSVTVTGVALTTKSLVLTTPQKHLAGVFVEAAVPNVAGSYVTIFLNQAVTQSFPVGWMVIERP